MDPHRSSAVRTAIFVYGVLSYVVFLGTFLYAIGFIGNFGVPRTLDGVPQLPLIEALLIDAALLGLFAVQHSVMARKGFKRVLTKVIPVAAERSTYVLASSLALIAVFVWWQPLGGEVWNLPGAGEVLMYAGYAFGCTLVLISTFAINHFDLFGLRQVWLEVTKRRQTPLAFKIPLLYRMVRHPLYVGWFFTFWCTPVMTLSHLFFAVMTTAYILVAIRFEEADLMRDHPEYGAYRQQVPMLIPRAPHEVKLTTSGTGSQTRTASAS